MDHDTPSEVQENSDYIQQVPNLNSETVKNILSSMGIEVNLGHTSISSYQVVSREIMGVKPSTVYTRVNWCIDASGISQPIIDPQSPYWPAHVIDQVGSLSHVYISGLKNNSGSYDALEVCLKSNGHLSQYVSVAVNVDGKNVLSVNPRSVFSGFRILSRSVYSDPVEQGMSVDVDEH